MASQQEVKDINLLMEALKGYNKTPKEADVCLNTLVTILSNNGAAKEHFRKLGGLALMLSIMTNSSDEKLKQTCLFTLATVIENKNSQEIVRNKKLYVMLKAFLKSRRVTLSTTAMYLLLCLSSENKQGQDFARETKCIHTLCDFFRQHVPPMNTNCDLGEQWFESLDKASLEQWVMACSALYVMQTNPQNAENQRVCSQLLVPSINILRSKTKQHKLLESVVMLTRACVTRSGEMQRKLCLTGGLRALNDLLEDCISKVEDQVSDKELLLLLKQLICTLGCAITGHAANQEAAVHCNTVPLLLKCLQLADSNSSDTALEAFKIKTLYTLLGCVDHCDGNQQLFVGNGGVRQLVDLLVKSQDDDLKRLASLVLHCCVVTKEQPTGDMEPERMIGLSSSTPIQLAKSTQTCLNQGIFVGNQTNPFKVTERQDTHDKSTMTCQDLSITQNASTQTTEVGLTSCDQQISEDNCPASAKSVQVSGKPARQAQMKFVHNFALQQMPWHSIRRKTYQLKRQAKEPLPTRSVKMFYSAEMPASSNDNGDDNDGSQCAACSPHVNSRNLLRILLNGDVCQQHKKLGELLVTRKSLQNV